jgi:hypothetical protein
MIKNKIRFFGFGMLFSVLLVFLYSTFFTNGDLVDINKAEETLNKQGFTIIETEAVRLLEAKMKELQNENKSLQEELTAKNEHPPGQSTTEVFTFSIQSGMNLEEIGKGLENINIVDSSVEFIQFMIDHKYDRKIQTGEFNLNKGMTFKEIAETITK